MATIRDVAQAAGVSPATVSLALNAKSVVKEETRQAVQEAALRLKYRPNATARSLVTRRTHVLGAVQLVGARARTPYTFQSVGDTYFGEMLASVEAAAREAGYSLLVERGGGPPSVAADPGRVDGLLFIGGVLDDAGAHKIACCGIPSVLVGARDARLCWADTDPEQGMYAMTRHVLQKGHRRLLLLNSPGYARSAAAKRAGFLRAAAQAGLEERQRLTAQAGYSGESACAAFAALWRAGARPTAVLTGADSMAAGVLRFLYGQGLRCPADVAVTGFEDSLLAAYAVPPLTTVQVHKDVLGAQAVKLLLERMAQPHAPPRQLVVEPHIVERGSA